MTTTPTQAEHFFTEAPASWNIRYRVNGFEEQITIRGTSYAQIAPQAESARKWVNEHAGKSAAAISDALNVELPAPSTTTTPAPGAPQAQNGNGKQYAHCMMIEVGTAYTSGKPQLKFNCDGFEHPLTYTKAVSDMVKLLSDIGTWTPDHLVVGKKYGVNCMVEYSESSKDGKTYKNVLAVKPSAA